MTLNMHNVKLKLKTVFNKANRGPKPSTKDLRNKKQKLIVLHTIANS